MYYKSAFSQICLASESFHFVKLRFGGLRTGGPSLVSGQYTSVGVYTLEVDERLLKAFCPTRLVLIGELIQGASAREQGKKSLRLRCSALTGNRHALISLCDYKRLSSRRLKYEMTLRPVLRERKSIAAAIAALIVINS